MKSVNCDIYFKAKRLGLYLKADGDKLLVKPLGACPAAFLKELRSRADELIEFLAKINTELSLWEIDCLHTSIQIVHGEFDGAPASTVNKLVSKLEHFQSAPDFAHPICQRALAVLDAMPTTLNTNE